MTTPERIWAIPYHGWDNGNAGEFATSQTNDSAEEACFVLATPEALAASPEVATLIAEARREWCKKMDRIADEIDEQVKVTRAYVGDCGMDHNQKELMKICTSHFLDKAANIRALKEETP